MHKQRNRDSVILIEVKMCLSISYSLHIEVRPSSMIDFPQWLPSSKARVVGHMLFLKKVTLKLKFTNDAKNGQSESIE